MGSDEGHAFLAEDKAHRGRAEGMQKDLQVPSRAPKALEQYAANTRAGHNC